MPTVATCDPEIAQVIENEQRRQRHQLVMIASENYTSAAVLETTGSVLTNKYAEGYPGRRYYAGCENVDVSEQLAIDRAKQLFGAEHANVQPHSGAQANMAAFFSLVNPGDRIMGMSLNHGGHLTHGSPVNFSGKLYEFGFYGVNADTEALDYAEVQRQAEEFKPAIIIAGYTAYPMEIDFKRFRDIADSINAILLVDMAHIAGLIAGGVHPSPVGYADIVTSTTHKTLRGPRGAMILCKADLAEAVDKAVFPGTQGGPHMHSIAAKAVAFGEALKPEFRIYSQNVVENAKVLAESLQSGGIRLVSGGTDTHLILIDCTSLGITGRKAQNALEGSGIIANRNTIPYDERSPFVTSGLRIGTPALTSRGMGSDEMKKLASWMIRVLDNPDGEGVREGVRNEVAEFAQAWPVPGKE